MGASASSTESSASPGAAARETLVFGASVARPISRCAVSRGSATVRPPATAKIATASATG